MKKLTFLTLMLLVSPFIWAQSISPLGSVTTQLSVNYGPDSVYVSTPGYTGMMERETYYATLIISLEETSDISEVMVGMGTSSQGTDLASATFSFDNRQESVGNVEYARDSYEFRVFLGEFSSKPNGYGWVKLKMSNGSYTQVLEEAIN